MHLTNNKNYSQSDDPPALRYCYPAMRHEEGDIIMPRDCILLKSGTRKGDLPYVAKVTALWENPEDGKSLKDFTLKNSSYNFAYICRRDDAQSSLVLPARAH
jgi:hypothetical protein